MKDFADFSKYLVPNETPLTQLLPKGAGWTVPDFCAKTKKEEVQPFMDYYQELVSIVDAVTPDEYEDDWGAWEPSEAHNKLTGLAFRIGQLAYQEVDNPLYDKDRCLAWKEDNMVNFTKIEWGTSDVVPVDSEAKVVVEVVRMSRPSSMPPAGGDQPVAGTED